MRINTASLIAIGCVLLAGGALSAPEAKAQSGSVKAIFEKHNLIGVYAWDCSKPATRQNYYYVHRLIDADHVQRDVMEGATTRTLVVMIDTATEVKPNEIAVSGNRDGKPFASVYRVEPTRMFVIESTVDGKPEISNGRIVGAGAMPALNKCGAPGSSPAPAPTGAVKALFEKHKMIATFAWDCGKPAGKQNQYYVHRLIDDDHVQGDVLDGPASRIVVLIIDKAEERNPIDVAVSGIRNGKPFSAVYRVEPTRMLVLESTFDGKTQISNGRIVGNGEYPALKKCGAPG